MRRCPTSASHRRTASIPSWEDTPTWDLGVGWASLCKDPGGRWLQCWSKGQPDDDFTVPNPHRSSCLVGIEVVFTVSAPASVFVPSPTTSVILHRRHLDWSADYFISIPTYFTCPRFVFRFLVRYTGRVKQRNVLYLPTTCNPHISNKSRMFGSWFPNLVRAQSRYFACEYLYHDFVDYIVINIDSVLILYGTLT